MKKWRFIFVCVVSLLSFFANCVLADQVTFISQYYSVVSSATERYREYSTSSSVPTLDKTWTGGYNVSSDDGTGVSGSTASPHNNHVSSTSSVGNMSLLNTAYGEDNDVKNDLTDTTYAVVTGRVDTNVTADWVFIANENLELSFDGFLRDYQPYDNFSIFLRDRTSRTDMVDVTGQTDGHLLSISNFIRYQEGEILEDNDLIFSLNASHEYELKISSWANTYDKDGFYHNVSVNLESVPEPATMLLLGFGLMGLVGVRRTIKK